MLRDIYHESSTPSGIEISPDGIVLFDDPVRGKKLSASRHNLTFFSHQKNLTARKWLEFASRLPSNLNSFMAQRNLTICGLSVNILTYANSVLRIYLNGDIVPAYTLNILNVKSIILDNLNVDISKSDIIKCELEITNGMVDYPIVNIDYAWRY